MSELILLRLSITAVMRHGSSIWKYCWKWYTMLSLHVGRMHFMDSRVWHLRLSVLRSLTRQTGHRSEDQVHQRNNRIWWAKKNVWTLRPIPGRALPCWRANTGKRWRYRRRRCSKTTQMQQRRVYPWLILRNAKIVSNTIIHHNTGCRISVIMPNIIEQLNVFYQCYL